MRTMDFVERKVVKTPYVQGTEKWYTKVISDTFRHKSGLILVRELHILVSPTYKSQYTRWTCPALGGGYASLSYWLQKGKQALWKRHNNK